MIKPNLLLHHIINPTLELLGSPYPDPNLRRECLMLAISLQETNLATRDQNDDDKPDDDDSKLGPALGWWQFERLGGVKGVMTHRTTRDKAYWLLDTLCIPSGSYKGVWMALQWSEIAATGFAAMLIRTIPEPLPELDEVEKAWNQYVSAWRPGKPHPETWEDHHNLAVETIKTYMSQGLVA